jgi:hypothetical protein
MFVDARTHRRRPDVLDAMPTIRLLFAMRGFGVDPYDDDSLADVLLQTCSTPDSLWLSREHFVLVIQQLKSPRQK